MSENTPTIKNTSSKKISFITEFFDFIKKFGVIGLALGVVIGSAVKTLVDSLVSNIINPILGIIIGKTDFSSLVIAGNIKIGSFINDIINFVILLFVVYMTVKIFLDRFLSEDEKKSLKM